MKNIVIFLAICWPALAWGLSGRVTSVVDGDSLIVEGVPVRLYGIDAPEHDQPDGEAATAWLTGLALGREARVDHVDRDRYGRQVAVVYVGDVCVQVEALRAGHAWVYDAYCKSGECRTWRRLEEQARQARVGVWADQKPTPPWAWRAAHRKAAP